MKALTDIQKLLLEHKTVLQNRYHVKEIGIFGSYVRQEQTDNSDVDVLVEFAKVPSTLRRK